MPRNRFIRVERFADDIVSVFVGIDNPREVHHLAETYALLPFHRFFNVFGMNCRTRVFKPGDGGDARRSGKHCL